MFVRVPFLLLLIFLGGITSGRASDTDRLSIDTTPVSTQKEAIAFIDQKDELAPSAHWPGIDPKLFLQNLKENIYHPLSLYEGISTNFCGYAALTGLFLQDNPLAYAKCMLQLYKYGKLKYRGISFEPGFEIRKAAGTLQYKGKLDIHPADQMWFLCLANHFKGYLNFFSRSYKPGREDALWACVNYAKFNRMVKKLLNYRVEAAGSDLIRPIIGDIYEYISARLKLGRVVLYVNNKELHQTSHAAIRIVVPTHYIILQQIEETNDMITLTYWDYGNRTRIQLTPHFLRRIVYGISLCTKKEGHE